MPEVVTVSDGTKNLTATYAGDTNFTTSTSTAETHAVASLGVVITKSGSNTDVTEGSGNDTYTINLLTVPSGNVEITITPDAQTDVGNGAGAAKILNFTTVSPQTVTITASDDTTIESDHTGTIAHAITGTVNDTDYPTSMSIASVIADITDNDAGVIITQTNSNATEDGATASVECKAEFDTASKVELIAKADSGSIFDRWSGKDCDTKIFLTSNHTCTAYFNLTPRTLTVDYPENGVITSSPAGIDCGNTSQKCNSEFEGRADISLIATPGIDGDINVPITIIDNDIVDGNQEVILSLGATENTSLIDPDTSILTIVDDDKPDVPMIEIPVDEIATTSISAPTTSTCASANVLKTTCNYGWKNAEDIVIEENGNIGYANIVTDIKNNQGRISNSNISEDVQVTGGILSGYINGANKAGEVVGTVAGKITNNSEVEGSFADVKLAPNTHIIGGILEQRIIGNSEQPAILESLLIRSKAIISNVIIADDVEWEEGVVFGENVSFSIHINYMKTHNIAKLPALGNPIFLKGKTTFAKFTGGASENGDVFKRKRTIKRKSLVTIKSNLLIDVKHIGKQADILVVAIHESKFYMLNSDGKPVIWNGNLDDLIAFQKPEKLAPVEAINIWDAPLDITGSVIVYVGYRLADGKIVYSPEDVIEMDFTD